MYKTADNWTLQHPVSEPAAVQVILDDKASKVEGSESTYRLQNAGRELHAHLAYITSRYRFTSDLGIFTLCVLTCSCAGDPERQGEPGGGQRGHLKATESRELQADLACFIP